jgi:hypothetical protein
VQTSGQNSNQTSYPPTQSVQQNMPMPMPMPQTNFQAPYPPASSAPYPVTNSSLPYPTSNSTAMPYPQTSAPYTINTGNETMPQTYNEIVDKNSQPKQPAYNPSFNS